jgi:uncharacterized membrane protein
MTAPGIVSQTPQRPRRWLVVGLVGSIALNLFLAGVFGAWLWRPVTGRHSGPPGPTISMTADQIANRVARRLPDADRPILLQAFKNHEDAIRQSLEDWRQAQQGARRSLRAEPFDPDAYTAAIMRSLAARENYNMAIHQAFREAATGMSHDGRVKLAMPGPADRRDAREAPPSTQPRR